jgi:hypothetical protein
MTVTVTATVTNVLQMLMLTAAVPLQAACPVFVQLRCFALGTECCSFACT